MNTPTLAQVKHADRVAKLRPLFRADQTMTVPQLCEALIVSDWQITEAFERGLLRCVDDMRGLFLWGDVVAWANQHEPALGIYSTPEFRQDDEGDGESS